MRQTAAVIVLWLLDVVVAVFIGSVDRTGHRQPMNRIRVRPDQRKKYALALSTLVLLAIVIYIMIIRW